MKIPSNVYLVKSAPQVEILKRASLFITHSGMNSSNESIHFGVPMICLPVSADQPLVANRVANELGLGIKLSVESLNSSDLRKAVMKMLHDDRTYHEQCLTYSQYSRKYKAEQIGADLIIKFLEKKDGL